MIDKERLGSVDLSNIEVNDEYIIETFIHPENCGCSECSGESRALELMEEGICLSLIHI